MASRMLAMNRLTILSTLTLTSDKHGTPDACHVSPFTLLPLFIPRYLSESPTLAKLPSAVHYHATPTPRGGPASTGLPS